MENITLPTAGLVVLKESKLLLAYSKNKKAWYLPGGKIDKGENSLEALKREVLEELNLALDAQRLKFYCHITAPAYGEAQHIMMEQDCFMYTLTETIRPSNEIEQIKYFDADMYALESIQVPGVLLLFEKLKADNLI